MTARLRYALEGKVFSRDDCIRMLREQIRGLTE
jgi:glycerol kinase